MSDSNSLYLREMKPGEEIILLKAARRAFTHSPMEYMAVSKPKKALIVEIGWRDRRCDVL